MKSTVSITKNSKCKLCQESKALQLSQTPGLLFQVETDEWTKPKIGLASVEWRTFIFLAPSQYDAEV